ncbi:MAG: UvrABC system protein C [Elusimicrobia bacterium]|nr:UvrABC system protein C [Elusimicrobiota bacterium]
MTSTYAPLPPLPHSPGVYLMRDTTGLIVYIGKAIDLKKRVSSYFSSSKHKDAKTTALVAVIRHVDYVPTSSEREALVVERRLINQFKPTFNIMWKDDKSYPYIVLSMKEDFPRLFLSRQKKRDGSLYFGPYPNVSQVRHLLHWAWRKKLFPLRPCRLDIHEGKIWPYEKVKSCLYLHTGQCPAPCLGKISSRAYEKIVDKARWFFGGQKDLLLQQWEKEMKALARVKKYEDAAKVRDRIITIQHMNERVTIREVNESMLNARIKESRAIQDLMRGLGMQKPPMRIECFDISHIQGSEKVASMVSFDRGRPDKSQYRKFIIKTVQGIDDFQSMVEVVGRRYSRLLREGKKLPDLILIDGGKGQLNSALSALEKLGLKKMTVAALAKEEEEIFLPGQAKSIRLEKDSPGLLLLRHVRDEAHRFAITFHRQRRQKRAFLV